MSGRSLADPRPAGIMFHHFHGAGHGPSQGSISADDLDDMIAYTGRDRILPAKEWMARALNGGLDEGHLCLTFDDNLRCQYDVALPVLRRHGVTAFWFVYTSVLDGTVERLEVYRHFRHTLFESILEFYEAFFARLADSDWRDEIERKLKFFDPATYLKDFPYLSPADKRFRYLRDEILGQERYFAAMDAMIEDYGVDTGALEPPLWMDDERLRRLHREGHVIGLHSHTHPTRLAQLSADAQMEEYRTNRDRLQDLLETSPGSMSHPCNDYGPETLAILRELGVVLGFRANMARLGNSALEYPRHNHATIAKEMQAL